MKIAPEYAASAVHVLDASRAVGVVACLLDPNKRDDFDTGNRAEQERLRERHANKRARPLLSFAEACANAPVTDWQAEPPPQPSFRGLRKLESIPLTEIEPYIDWNFFFAAWELKGRFPKILEHPRIGAAARELYDNARDLLRRIIEEGSLQARAAYGFWPANAVGEDIVLFADEERREPLLRLPMLRQQTPPAPGGRNRSLADFIAPADTRAPDWIGAFAVTAGIGAEELIAQFEARHDDYSAIMSRALADRLAEALAEWLHERARRDWGYETHEKRSNPELIAENYRGIRPAFGYPACPDHRPKCALFELLDAPSLGMSLTESCAMRPAASVSGLYFAHPRARYFNLGRIDRDQIVDYARRCEIEIAEAERWLATNLAYDPAADAAPGAEELRRAPSS